MTDILREVEEKDTKNLVETHVFITQYKEKFDIRTTMLVRRDPPPARGRGVNPLKPNSITLAGSNLVRSWFEAISS